MQERRALSRRQVLKTAGITLALPALASVPDLPFLRTVRALQADGESPRKHPRRFCCIFFPNGVSLPPEDHPAHEEWHWFPHQVGSDYKLTRPLEPLAKLRKDLTILSM